MEFKDIMDDFNREAKAFFSIFQIKKWTYEELLERFNSRNPDVRLSALKEMAKRKEPEIPALITRCLAETPSVVTYEAEDILIKMGKPIIPILLPSVGGNKDTQRRSAVRILDSLGDKLGKLILRVLEKKKGALDKLIALNDPRCIPPLIEALKAEENSIRHSAAEALGKIGDPAGVPALINALSDKNGWVKNAARDSLKSMGNKISQSVPDMMVEIPNESKHVILSILGDLCDPAMLQVFRNFLDDDDPQIREAAVTAAGKLNLPEITDSLQKALKDRDPDVRKAAVLALGNSDYFFDEREKYTDYILPLINDPDWKVRSVTAGILGAKGDSRGIPALIPALKDNDWQVRLAAVESLGRLESQEIWDKIAESAKDPVWIVRKAAVEVLGNRRTSSSLNLLKHTVKDENADVRASSCFSAGIIGDEVFIPILTELLSDPDPSVRAASAEALGAFTESDSARIADALIRLLRDSSFVVKNSALITLGKFREISAVEPVMDIMKQDGGKLRLQAVKTLGEIGSNKAVPLMLKILKTDPSISAEIIVSLGKIGDTMSLQELSEYLPSITDARLRESVYETIDRILKENKNRWEGKSGLVCSRCYHRFRQFDLTIPGRNNIKYSGCRSCRGSEAFEGIDKVIAILDREMKEDYILKEDELLINRKIINSPFDFDEVRILHADDFDVEGFVMTMRNDMDTERRETMKSKPVIIAREAEISKNKINLLRMNFRTATE